MIGVSVPKLRFPEFSGEWEEKKLGTTGKFFSGGTPLTTNKEFYNGNIPFIKSGEISKNNTEQFISEKGLKNSSAKLVKKGDLLFALYGATSGEVAISKINGAINQAVLNIETNSDNIFLYNYFLKEKARIRQTYLQGGQGNLSAKLVKSLKLSIPSMGEQKKISSFLSKVDSKIEKLEKKQHLWKTYKKGIMQQIFSQKLRFKDGNGEDYPDCEFKKLREIAIVNDGTHFTPEYKETGIPFFSVETVVNNIEPKYISQEEHEKLIKRCQPKNGDILLTRIGTLAKSKLVDWGYDFSIYVSLALIKPKKSINSSYLNQYFKTNIYKRDFLSKSLLLATPMKINVADLKSTIVQVPCLKEQEKISNFLSVIDRKIRQLDNELNNNKQFKKGLLQQIFC